MDAEDHAEAQLRANKDNSLVSNGWDVNVAMPQAKGQTCLLHFREVSGPTFRSATFDGPRVLVRFDQAHNGLIIKDHAVDMKTYTVAPATVATAGNEVKGFALAGADHRFYRATAHLSQKGVTLTSPGVPHPVAARYGWANFPSGNLFNKEGLPAFAFRTDNWNLGLGPK